MSELTRGPARKLVPAREFLDKEELKNLLDAGTVIVDERRRRPLYFDGRFLAARDLTREQNYFLTRQADLGQAGGAGVVHGLLVERDPDSARIRIGAGHGVTIDGELVVLPEEVHLELENIAETQRLNAAFGLIGIPNEPARTRSGLFILALRPVEFTANPIASYPTSIDGTRTIEDGSIIEGVGITLIPYPDEGSRNELNMRRARVAQKIFVEGATKGVPAGVLPLAMIALDRGVVRWIDAFMVRREVGAEHGDILGLGFAPRAMREAHLLQYEHHLREVIRERGARGLRFAASEHFLALPPAGHMPAAAIDARDFTQIYFPAEMQVDLSIIPEDEIAALLEESLLLPPIDLTLGGEELESTSVMALIPVTRERFRVMNSTLPSLTQRLNPAAPGMIARRKPLEALRILKLPFGKLPISETIADDAWRKALSEAPLLWYVRRRNLNYKATVTGSSVAVVNGNERDSEERLIERLRDAGLERRFARLENSASAQGRAELVAMLSSPKLAVSNNLLGAAIHDLEKEDAEKMDRATVLKISERFADPKLGEGLARLESVNPAIRNDPKIVKKLVESGTLLELDRQARLLNETELSAFALKVATDATGGNRDATPRRRSTAGRAPRKRNARAIDSASAVVVAGEESMEAPDEQLAKSADAKETQAKGAGAKKSARRKGRETEK